MIVKRKRFISLLITAVCMFLFAMPAFATIKASSQISQYDMSVTPVTNTLNINFSIMGNNLMDKIGCESIYVYEKSGSRWALVDSWDEDDPGMSLSNIYVTDYGAVQKETSKGVATISEPQHVYIGIIYEL